MQIPLLLVETVSKGISIYLDLRNYHDSVDFHPRLEQPPKVKFYDRISYLNNKKMTLAFLIGRLTSSSDSQWQVVLYLVALRYEGHISLLW